MPSLCRLGKQLNPLGCGARATPAAIALMVCAAFLAGCAGSSGSFTPVGSSGGGTPAMKAMNMANGAGDPASPGYNADGSVSAISSTNPSAFTATPAAVAHSSAASQAADKVTAAARPGTSAYMIGPLDVLDISVFKIPDLAKTVQVAEDGTINYPLLGDVHAGGMTAKELEQDLGKKLGAKYVRDPQVTVMIKEYNSQRVTIEGSVKNTGVYSIKGKTTLMQVMAMSGGVDDTTASGDVVIFRTINGVRSAGRFDTDAIRKGTAEDPELQPGDVILVDTSATKLAFTNILKVLPLATTGAFLAGL